MSRELGPIHYMMYDKIKFQDKITAELLKDQKELFEELSKKMPPVSEEPLHDLIDTPNIHGWLASRIDIVEARLSFALHAAKDPEKTMEEIGRREAEGAHAETAEDLFPLINRVLLDGMPCDAALLAETNTDGDLLLIQEVDTHADFETNPLLTDPALSLKKTCAGGHDHDRHETFEVHEGERHGGGALGEEKAGEASLYHRCRLALLRGLVRPLGFDAELVGRANYRIYKI